MENFFSSKKTSHWLDQSVISSFPGFKIEHLLVFLILLAAVISRFYNVGLRVMSHDEVNHVVPSYDLYIGKGYSHDPVTHGPLQFHLLAASYFLLGDSDFSSRVPSVLFSIATILFVMFAFRRYLGRTGALLSGFFFLISPYMLFYGRYTRNESFVALFGVIMLYAVLLYLEKGKNSALYLYTAVLALHFCTKETAFIYTAEILIFLALIFLKDIAQKEWKNKGHRDSFILITITALLLIGLALAVSVLNSKSVSAVQTVAEGAIAPSATAPSTLQWILYGSLGGAGLALIVALYVLISGLGWSNLKNIRSFNLLVLTFTMVMPQLIAFPIKLLGWDPLDYSQLGLIRSSIFLAATVIIATTIGLLWKPSLWLRNMALFYAIFTIFYTTLFTNGQGFFTGMVGSLGYWLSQQGVDRGSQPWYYYPFLQLPMYEYLALSGTFLAFIIGIKHKLFSTYPNIAPAQQIKPFEAVTQLELPVSSEDQIPQDQNTKRLPVLALLLFWSVMSLIAYTIAGEKMPWLTVHITLGMLLSAGFSLGYLIDSLSIKKINPKTILGFLLLPVFLISLGKVLGLFFGVERPFSGMELAQLQLTSTFIFALIAVVLSGWGILHLLDQWETRSIFKTLVITIFGILSVLTARSAFQANYINYDTGKEFLVYAHSARGPKDVLLQVEEISKRTTGGKEIKVAYIGDALYPYWWYFRDYPNKTWLKDQLTRDLLQYPVVITDDTQLTKTRAILKDGYSEFKYKRLVWPTQEYFNLKLPQVWEALKNPQMLQAIFSIWLNKDYSLYASLKNLSTLTVENWEPSGNIYLFIKKDIVSSIWTYGNIPASQPSISIDPYQTKLSSLTPDTFFGSSGTTDGQLTNPRGIAISKDGSIYVADSRNHRIQHFSAEGNFILSWGTFASVDNSDAPGGTFNEPWGIAVGPDGSVYVADTWNYRIQKFTSDGKFITMWGTPGTSDSPTTFWGPRGIVVGQDGHVYITDTGNNRVVIFDDQGNYLSQFGIVGINPGEFDEPVGLAMDNSGNLYVVDTWNQRIQVFQSVNGGLSFQPIKEWAVSGWIGQSVNNKPFIAVDKNGNIFVTDPDAYRVLEFDPTGALVRGWGDYSSGIDGFGMPSGIAVDQENRIWVSDADNNFLLRFSMPVETGLLPQGVPALPISSAKLIFNPSTGLVENALQQAVYQLDSDSQLWMPVIPENIAPLLPTGMTPVKNKEGLWTLSRSDGSDAFHWDGDLLIWVSAFSIDPTSTE
ncbi:MAG: TIGR03663 family protein [Chloroflexi bacterium]|nr:TIGR03663 family protein [Chloroflexota bacterium]